MAIKNTSFAKGEAVQKLIEVIARVNNKSVAGDTALQTAIDEVREMFKSDEMTVDSYENIMALAAQGGLEPGHMYSATIEGHNVSCIAKDASSFFSLIMVDDIPCYCDDFESLSATPLLTEVITTVDYDSAMQRITDQGFYRIINRTGDYVSDVIVLVTQPQLHPEHEVAFATIEGAHVVGYYNYMSDTFTPLNDDFIGTNDITSIINIPVTKSVVNATITAGGTVSFAPGLKPGREVFVIATNLSGADIELGFDTIHGLKTIKVEPEQSVEFSCVCAESPTRGSYHIRVTESIETPTTGEPMEEFTADEIRAMFE